MYKIAVNTIKSFMAITGKRQKGAADYIGISQKHLNQLLNHPSQMPGIEVEDKILIAFPVLDRNGIRGPRPQHNS